MTATLPAIDQLEAMLARATSSCPEVIEFGSETHRHWLNGVTRARIEIVEALPALLACARALPMTAEWLCAALDCKDWHWDPDQYSAAWAARTAAAKALQMLESGR